MLIRSFEYHLQSMSHVNRREALAPRRSGRPRDTLESESSMKSHSLLLWAAAAAALALPGADSKKGTRTEVQKTMFMPPPLTDDWTKWMVGEWEGAGTSDSGKGSGTVHIELALGGQFLICRGDAKITELNPDYLKKHMHATDEEVERFQRSGYQSLEVYTIDQQTGEVIGFLFDNLRCVAQGKGTRDKGKETVAWEWHSGHKSTRITERVSDDRMRLIERTPNPDGSVMEDQGEMMRIKRRPAPESRHGE